MVLEHIYNLPLDVFNTFLSTAARVEARQRMAYIADTSVAVASVLGGAKAVEEYMTDLENLYEGGTNGR